MQQPNSIVHSVNRQNVVLLIGSNDNQLQWVDILLCWKSLASCYPALVEQVGWDGSTSCSGPPPPLQPPPSTVGRGQTNHSKWSPQVFGWNMWHIFLIDFFLFFWLDLVYLSHFIYYLAMKQKSMKLWGMDPSIQVVSEFQRRAVIAIVIVMEEWSSGDESLESSLVSEFFNILLSLWHSFIRSTLVRSDFLPNQIFFVYLMTVYQ